MLILELFFIVLFVGWCSSEKLPDFIRPCHRSDPAINECILKQANDVISEIIKGIDYLKIPSMLPMFLPQINISLGDDLKIKLFNISIGGFDTSQLLDVKVDFNNKHVWSKAYFGNFHIFCKHNIKGKIFILPIEGSGSAKVNFDGVTTFSDLHYDLVENNDKMYINITEIKLNYNVKRVHYQLDDIFNGDKLLGNAFNKFLNENSKTLHKDYAPYISKVMEDILLELVDYATKVIPYDDIFLP